MVFGNYEIQRICNIYGTKEYSENTRETLPTTSQTEGEQNKLNQPNKKQKSNPPATKNIYIYIYYLTLVKQFTYTLFNLVMSMYFLPNKCRPIPFFPNDIDTKKLK